MQRVTIELSDVLYAELQSVLDTSIHQSGYGPADFAQEVVENELASRRLRTTTPGRYGPRIATPVEGVEEPEPYRVAWPESRSSSRLFFGGDSGRAALNFLTEWSDPHMQEKENKSQLAKDLANALFICRLRDDLSELVDDATFRQTVTEEQYKSLYHSYLKATVLLACAVVDSKDIKNPMGGGQ